MTNSIELRPATPEDFPQIFALFQTILQEGKTYAYSAEEMDRARADGYWLSAPGTHGYVALIDGQFAGCFAIRPNRTGRADHVANASFIVHHDFRRNGVGRTMGKKAIELATSLGYQALQYNFVVADNKVAIKLWESLGFSIIGTQPKGFKHPQLGLVDVHIMHRYLNGM